MAGSQYDNFFEAFANLSLEDHNLKRWVNYLENQCLQFQIHFPGIPFQPNSYTAPGFEQLLPKARHYWTDYCRLYCRNLDQQQRGVLLQVCSWNPEPDRDLSDKRNERPTLQKQRCLYGTLAVMAPDVLCLQEPIWYNLLRELLKGEPQNNSFLFPRNYKVWRRRDVAMEAAILYNPAKLEVFSAVANEVALAWRERAESVQKGLGARTVALKGTIRLANTDIIIISIHMFHRRFTDSKKLRMMEAIIWQAQEFANERNTTVLVGGDWNCHVYDIILSAGSFMPNPVNHLGLEEKGGVDRLIIINPALQTQNLCSGCRYLECKCEIIAISNYHDNYIYYENEECCEDDGNDAEDGYDAEDGNDAEDDDAYVAYTDDVDDSDCYADSAEDKINRECEILEDFYRSAANPICPNLKLDNVQFFSWIGNVTANDMGGLEPANIDRIYRLGGKHRPIVANIRAD